MVNTLRAKFRAPKYINLLTGLYYFLFLCALGALFVPPHRLWIGIFFTLSIPVFVILNFFLPVLLFIIRSPLKWLSLVFLCVSVYLFFQFYKISGSTEKRSEADLRLISFNMSGYRIRRHKEVKKEIEQWLLKTDADVICLEEYYNDGEAFLQQRYPYRVIRAGHKTIGLATFSRYPIVKEGVIFIGHEVQNKGIYTDIRTGEKICRVINVHIESNGLNVGNPFYPLSDFFVILRTLKQTAGRQSREAETLARFIDSCQGPTILAGDFNEPPYSYIYRLIRRRLQNSFEAKGKGFGFTYNPHKAFLRIDHQFFNNQVEVTDYKVHSRVWLSDHVPVEGGYVLKR